MKTATSIMAFIAIISFSHVCLGQQLGDPGWIFDDSRYDSRFPAMIEYAKSGVEGGIPYRGDNPIKQTLSVVSGDNDMADNIQSAIDAVAGSGGGVVLLNNGTYPIRSQITMKSDVILRGQSKDGVLLEVFMRFEGASEPEKKEVFYWRNIQNAGLEDFSMIYNTDYQGQQMYPLDHDWAFDYFSQYSLRSQNYKNERVYHDRPNFNYHTVNNIDVIYVRMDDNTKNCWIDNCNFRDSGSALIIISNPSTHITIRNCLIQGAFQKGNNGHGYGINCSGTYVLMVKNTVKNVRHWAIQQGAIYNVVYDCHSETDMNFHQGDQGLNLIENSKIHVPHWHIWKPFQTGADYHGDPGEGNMFYNNDVIDRSNGPKYTDQQIYTFNENRDVVVLSSTPPSGGTLYAVKRGANNPPTVSFTEPNNNQNFPEGSNVAVKVNATDDGSVSNVKLYLNDDLVRQENSAPYEWGLSGQNDLLLENVAAGTYTLRAMATDNLEVTSEATITITVGSVAPLQNFALNQPTTASANDGNVPGNAVDDDTSTRWSASGYPQWLEVDLGSVKSISKTALVCYQDRAYQFIIEAKSTASGTYTQIVNRSSNATSGTVANPITDVFAATDARYVKITVSGASGYSGSWISLLEFRVFGSTTTPIQNLALNKPASQSSTDYGGVASRAVDGNTIGVYNQGSVTHTDNQANAWWQVDLGSVSNITNINVWNRTDCCGNRLSDFHTFVSDNPFTSTNLNTTINQSGVGNFFTTGQGGTPTTINVNRSGRYIRVQLAGANNLSLAEIEVNGTPSSTSSARVINSGLAKSFSSIENQSNFKVFPNPFSSTLSVHLKDQHSVRQVSLVDINGKIIFNRLIRTKAGNEVNINSANYTLPQGLYFLRIIEVDQIHTFKLSKF